MTKEDKFIDWITGYFISNGNNEIPSIEEIQERLHEAIEEHEAAHIKLSPEIFNKVQLKRVTRMLKELSEESWKAAGGDSKEWIIWYKKRGAQHLNQPKEGGNNG